MSINIEVNGNELLFMAPKITHRPQEKRYYISISVLPEEIKEISQTPENSILTSENDMLFLRHGDKLYTFCLGKEIEPVISSFHKDHSIYFIFCHAGKIIMHVAFHHKIKEAVAE